MHFIDPSLADDFWKDAAATQAHFRRFGLDNVRHHLHTTQEFVTTPEYASLTDIGLIFIDGYHTAEQARFDYEAFADRLAPRGIVLFHDSMILKPSGIYGPDRRYDVDVKHYMDELRQDPRPAAAGPALRHRPDRAAEGRAGPTAKSCPPSQDARADDRARRRRRLLHARRGPPAPAAAHRPRPARPRARGPCLHPQPVPAPGVVRRRALRRPVLLLAAGGRGRRVTAGALPLCQLRRPLRRQDSRRGPPAAARPGGLRHLRRHRPGDRRGTRRAGDQRLRGSQRGSGAVPARSWPSDPRVAIAPACHAAVAKLRDQPRHPPTRRRSPTWTA